MSITGVSRALFLSIFGWRLWSACSQLLTIRAFSIGLGPAQGDVSFASIPKSHTVAAVPRGQKRPLGDHSGAERLRWPAGMGMCFYCNIYSVRCILRRYSAGSDAVASQQTHCPKWYRLHSFRVAVVPPFLSYPSVIFKWLSLHLSLHT